MAIQNATSLPLMVGVSQPVHWFLVGKGLGIQQGMSVWIGLPKLIIVFSYHKVIKF